MTSPSFFRAALAVCRLLRAASMSSSWRWLAMITAACVMASGERAALGLELPANVTAVPGQAHLYQRADGARAFVYFSDDSRLWSHAMALLSKHQSKGIFGVYTHGAAPGGSAAVGTSPVVTPMQVARMAEEAGARGIVCYTCFSGQDTGLASEVRALAGVRSRPTFGLVATFDNAMRAKLSPGRAWRLGMSRGLTWVGRGLPGGTGVVRATRAGVNAWLRTGVLPPSEHIEWLPRNVNMAEALAVDPDFLPSIVRPANKPRFAWGTAARGIAGGMAGGLVGGLADSIITDALGNSRTGDALGLTANFGAQAGALYLAGGEAMSVLSIAAAPATVYTHFWNEQMKADMSRYDAKIRGARIALPPPGSMMGRDTSGDLTAYESSGRWMLSWAWDY